MKLRINFRLTRLNGRESQVILKEQHAKALEQLEQVYKRFYVNKKTYERIVKHIVVNAKGRIVDEHFRPNYKPRKGEVEGND